jgi:hypothetical protein
MKSFLACILFLIIAAGCKKQPSALLAQRWNFAAMDMPKLEKFLNVISEENDDAALTMEKLFLDNKLILRKDSSFDMLLMKQYVHGKWQYNEVKKVLNLIDESARRLNIQFGVDSVSIHSLHLDTDKFAIEKLAVIHLNDPFVGDYLFNKSYYQFFLTEDNERFSKLSEDPYSKENNWWRIKPSKPETDAQIKKRVLNHLAFWQLLFHDALEKDRAYVSYNWFSSPIVVASNGVVMKFYDEVKKEWDENFYDSIQAHKGYEMMRKCFSKKIKYLETDNKFRRNEDIIKQLTNNFLEATNSIKN